MASLLSIWQKSESISFQSPTMVEIENFCLEKYSLPKKVTSDTSNTVLAILSKNSYKFSDVLSVKLRKKILIEIHRFSETNMLILIKILWTRRTQLWKSCRNFYSAVWNFVCQNPKWIHGIKFCFNEKNFGYDVPLDENISVSINFRFFSKKLE